MLQYFRQCLEDVEDFNGLHDHFDTFMLYRGKKSLDDEDDDAGRLAGYFKVMRDATLSRYHDNALILRDFINQFI